MEEGDIEGWGKVEKRDVEEVEVIYQARESSLIPTGFLTPHFLQEMQFMKPLF